MSDFKVDLTNCDIEPIHIPGQVQSHGFMIVVDEGGVLAARQKKFIDQLEAALIRIQNKTYGICRGTGKLIPAERLRAVPHTTMSMEAKLKQA